MGLGNEVEVGEEREVNEVVVVKQSLHLGLRIVRPDLLKSPKTCTAQRPIPFLILVHLTELAKSTRSEQNVGEAKK